MEKNKEQLRNDAKELAVAVCDACNEIKGARSQTDQLTRASSSIGANLREAKYAQSRQDFISKLEIALKEAFETEYWLELLFETRKLDEQTYKYLKNKCGSIRRRIIASVKTAKNGKATAKKGDTNVNI